MIKEFESIKEFLIADRMEEEDDEDDDNSILLLKFLELKFKLFSDLKVLLSEKLFELICFNFGLYTVLSN